MASTRKATSKRSAATKTKKAASSKRPATKSKSVSKATKNPTSTKKKKTSQQAESKNVKFLPKLPASITLRSRLSLIALSPYRFPLDIDRLAIQSARVAGVSFVLVGAIFTFLTAKPVVNQLALETVPLEQSAATYEGTKQRSTDGTTASSLPNVKVDFVVGALSGNGDRSIELETAPESTQVILRANDLETGKAKDLGRMKMTSRDGQVTRWSSTWRTDELSPGRYRLTAEITEKDETTSYLLTDSNTYSIDGTDSNSNTKSDSTQLSASRETDSTNTSTQTTDVDDARESPEIAFRELGRDEVSGYIRLTLGVNYNPEGIEIYAAAKNSTNPRFLGRAKNDVNGTWYFDWNTTNSPNGEYVLFAEAKSNDGQIQSDDLKINVLNDRTSHSLSDNGQVRPTVEPSRITDTRKVIEEVKAEIDAETPDSRLIAEDILRDYKTDLDESATRLAVAIRGGDPSAIEQANTRIDELKRTMLRDSVTTGTDVFVAKINEQLDGQINDIKERVERTEKIVRERVGEEVSRDTDKDGVSDYDEVTLYQTDPFSADSDGDGFTDGAEIISGFDPADGSSEAVVEYESPKDRGLVRSDILQVREIKTLKVNQDRVAEHAGDTPSAGVVPQLLVSGQALPNSFVTLFVFSSPIVVTVKTDEEGNWSYQFDKELEDGEHEVYVGLTDNTGKLVAKSEPFSFVKTAEAYSAVASTVDEATSRSGEDRPLLGESILMFILSISVLIIGLVLLLLGFHLKNRGEHLVAEDYSPNPAA